MTADEGPVLASWLLSNRLVQGRTAAGRSLADAAKELGVHQQTIRRWENAESPPKRALLLMLCRYYGMPEDQLEELEGLRERADQPGWWTGTGKWPDATAELLGMEMAAVRIRGWDLAAIPGLLQTPEYARLIIQAVEPNTAPTRVDSGVDLRMDRQTKVFGGPVSGGPVREATFMFDEMALARLSGSAAIRQAQIARLLTPPPLVRIQVVPFSVGSHPGLGSFLLFDFDSTVIDKGVFVEGSVAGRSRVETGAGVQRYEQVWAWLQAKALTPEQTTTFLEEKLERINHEQR